tara:strand:- start:3132 stop:3500 length:369 start_codon:yes stop_codon:yes gene_type:complete
MPLEYKLLDIFLWIFCVAGLTTIITSSSIFLPIREFVSRRSNFFGELLQCYICSSFWISLALSLLYTSPTNNIFLDAVFGTGVVWLLSKQTQNVVSEEDHRMQIAAMEQHIRFLEEKPPKKP